MSERGWCPFARQHRGPGSEGPFGYPSGTRGQNRPVLFIDHTMAGWKRTLDDDDWRHENGVGVTFGIGLDGSIDQYTSIFDAHWANGVAGSVQKYDRGNARLAQLEALGQWVTVRYAGTTAYALVSGGVNVLNTHSISTEHEDGGVLDRAWTPEMLEADIRVKRWCIEELAREGMAMDIGPDVLAGHFQIDAVNRSHCPGAGWPKAQILEALEEDMVTKGEFEAAFGFELRTRDLVMALGSGLAAVARSVGAQGAEIDALEQKVAASAAELANIEKLLKS